jgi:hypothetical protein
MKELSEDPSCEHLIQSIADFLRNMKDDPDYEKPCVQLIKFCKKLSKQPESHKYLYKTKMYSIALKHISIKGNESFENMDEQKLMEKLQTIHKVLRMVKHLFEG